MQENRVLNKKCVKKHILFAYIKESLYLCIKFSKHIETVRQEEEHFAQGCENRSLC